MYIDDSKPKKERDKKFEKLENEFFQYLINLEEDEIISFISDLKNIILDKKYLSKKEKAYKIVNVIFNGLFWIIYEEKDGFKKNDNIKKCYYKLWDIILRLYIDSYLLEKKEYYFKYIDKQ
jgi:hypothetical protein